MTHYLIEVRLLGKTKYELKRLIRKVNRIFHIRGRRPVPHITLVGPFYTTDEERLISDFKELCEQQTTMRFKIKGFGTFEENRVVFINIEADKNLDAFRWALFRKLQDYCSLSPYDYKKEFSYHLTIAMKLGQDKFERLKKYILIKPEPEYAQYVLRVTLLKNSKILREYDFFLRRLLKRRESKSRYLLSESCKRLKEFLERSGHAEVERLEKTERAEEVDVSDILKKSTSKIFFISDLHLDHANIIKYCNRPFRSVSEMNDFIVNTWNKTVGKNDIVYFLGDMACGRGSRKTRFWLEKLNGNIVFIKGHHDKSRYIKFYDRLILNYQGHRFLLIHNPRDAPSDWGDWVIHGHTHNNSPEHPLVNKNKKTINVSAELINYKPISLGELLSRLGDPLPKSTKNICFYCGKIIRELPYRCNYCGEVFCLEHRLPENHVCKSLPQRSWETYRKERTKQPELIREPSIWVHESIEYPVEKIKRKTSDRTIAKKWNIAKGCGFAIFVTGVILFWISLLSPYSRWNLPDWITGISPQLIGMGILIFCCVISSDLVFWKLRRGKYFIGRVTPRISKAILWIGLLTLFGWEF